MVGLEVFYSLLHWLVSHFEKISFDIFQRNMAVIGFIKKVMLAWLLLFLLCTTAASFAQLPVCALCVLLPVCISVYGS